MDLTLGQVLAAVRDLGTVGLLVVILFGGAKGWWVFGWQYRLKSEEADEWKAIALAGTRIAEAATEHIARRPRGGP